MIFAGVEITPDTIKRTRQHFADNCQACIDEIKSGAVRVDDPQHVIEWQQASAAYYLAGKSDHTFTFAQRAHWLQTGECIPLFSK